MQTGLIKYDSMTRAIAECREVDELKDYRDKARALELYAQQARNRKAEAQAAEIRIRAERACKLLIREEQANGKLAKAGGDRQSNVGRNDNAQKPLLFPPALRTAARAGFVTFPRNQRARRSLMVLPTASPGESPLAESKVCVLVVSTSPSTWKIIVELPPMYSGLLATSGRSVTRSPSIS